MTLSAPIPLADHHELSEFNSSVPELNDWLRRRARANQVGGASRTFVVCEENRVIAYYALASGAVKQRKRQAVFGATCPIQFRLPCLVVSPLISPIRGGGSAERWCATQAYACSMPLKSSAYEACLCMRFPMMREPSIRRSAFFLRHLIP